MDSSLVDYIQDHGMYLRLQCFSENKQSRLEPPLKYDERLDTKPNMKFQSVHSLVIYAFTLNPSNIKHSIKWFRYYYFLHFLQFLQRYLINYRPDSFLYTYYIWLNNFIVVLVLRKYQHAKVWWIVFSWELHRCGYEMKEEVKCMTCCCDGHVDV